MNACRARASVRNPKSMESKVRLSTKWGSNRQYTSRQVDCYPSLPEGRMPLFGTGAVCSPVASRRKLAFSPQP